MLGLSGKIGAANAPKHLSFLLALLLSSWVAVSACLGGEDATQAASPGLEQGVQQQRPAPGPGAIKLEQTEDRETVLSSGDCSKCHDQPQKDIEAAGMAHKTKVTCTDCHRTHPPDKWGAIPECSLCHSGEKHFELGAAKCMECHYNPHMPLKLKLTKDMTSPCLTCHDEQNAQLKEFPTFHSRLACTACHFQHGLIPPCGRCHAPHNDAMSEKICHECHKAHMPLNIVYGEVASEDCGTCHEEAYTKLAASPRKHRGLKCSRCHVEKHKMVPDCRMCHDLPHAEDIHAKFPLCGECHGPAHDLRPADTSDRLPRSDGKNATHLQR